MNKERMKTKVRDIRDRIGESDASGSLEKLRSYVSENPGKALLMSVGVGFLFGLMLRSDAEDADE